MTQTYPIPEYGEDEEEEDYLPTASKNDFLEIPEQGTLEDLEVYKALQKWKKIYGV
jgi:hypothetical protein